MYRPRSATTPQTTRRLIDFIKLIHKADDATFARDVEKYLDVETFLRFVAANALLANMDSFLSTGHNFYLYVHPDTLKIHFIPWDLNLSFGTFDWVGTLREQAELSLRQPYVKPNRLTERLLSIDKYATAYRAEAARITDECLAPARVKAHVEAAREAIAKAERLAGVPHRPLPADLAPEVDVQTWAERRFAAVRKQLVDGSDGYVPYWQSGFFGRAPKPATRPTSRPATAPADAKASPKQQ
jgi:hypothetical protein